MFICLNYPIILILRVCFYSIVYWEKLQYPFLHKSGAGMLADIHDGSVIKNLMKPGHFLSKPEHAALILNRDGVMGVGNRGVRGAEAPQFFVDLTVK